MKAERAEEERRMEDEFKQKLMEKYAEDERLEQMNAQKRRMRQLEHKREIERLWQEKLKIYREQRDLELQEQAAQRERNTQIASVIEEAKRKMLEEHAEILQNYHPKAGSQYMGQFAQRH